MGFLGSVFEKKDAKTITRALAASASARSKSFAVYGKWDIEKAIVDGIEKSIWVYRCVDAIASHQARIPIQVQNEDGSVGSSPKVHQLLNLRPNGYLDSHQFRYILSGQMLLSLRGVFIEIVGEPSAPEELHILPPQFVEPQVITPGGKTPANGLVTGYKIRGADFEEYILKPEQVIWIKPRPHLLDPMRQMTIMQPIAAAVETDIMARAFNLNFLRNDGRPGLLVAVKGHVSEQDAQELKRRFSYGNAGRTSVIEADGLDLVDMAATPRDVQWMEAMSGAKEDILLAFGVPESVLGNASGRTYDNADAEYLNFWQMTMLPHCDALARGLDVLTGDIWDGKRLAFDYSKVEALQQAEARWRSAFAAEVAAGLRTVDSYFEVTNQDKWNVPATQVLYHPKGIVIAKDDETSEKVSGMAILGAKDPAAEMGGAAQQGALEGARQGMRDLDSILSARDVQGRKGRQLQIVKSEPLQEIETKEAADVGDDPPRGPFPATDEVKNIVDAVVVHPYRETRIAVESSLNGLMLGWSSRQQDVVLDRLDHAKVRKGTRHWEGETKAYKALDAGYVVDVDRWVSDVQADVRKLLTPVLKREAGKAARDLAKWDFAPDQDINFTMDSLMLVVDDSVRRQSAHLIKLVSDMDAAGKSLDEIKAAIRKQIGTRSSWRRNLSTYLTTTGIEGVKEAMYSQHSRAEKTWWTEADERVRPSHWELEGETVSGDDWFVVGTAMMKYPGDPTGPINETANCRCYLEWSIK